MTQGMKRLRSVQVVNVRWFNATAWYGLFLAKLLRAAGYETRVLALADTECFAQAEEWGLEPIPLDLNSANPWQQQKNFSVLRALIREFRPHVINCHRGEAFYLFGLLKRLEKNFSLVRTRGDQRPPKVNWANRFLHTHVADALVATNSMTARAFTQDLRVPADKVHTILGGVDTHKFYPDPAARARIRQEYGFTDEHQLVGLVGRFDTVKGQKECIEAMARLLHSADNTNKQLRLLLVGYETAVSQATVESWLRHADIAQYSVITGKDVDVAACINALDLAVAPSLSSEAIARAALEIMACKVPLLASSVGVMPDLLPQQALIPAGDSVAMAQAISLLLHDTLLRQSILDCTDVQRHGLTEQDFLLKTLSVYTECLKEPQI